MKPVDLLVLSAAQLCVIPPQTGGPQRGAGLGELGLIEDGAVAIAAGRVVAVGPTRELAVEYHAIREIDACNRVVVPGFVDPHTHLVWMGDRAAEFERRIAGATYMEIMAAGGGIPPCAPRATLLWMRWSQRCAHVSIGCSLTARRPRR